MKKRVPIGIVGVTAVLLALGPAFSASAWSSVLIPNKPADCPSQATGSSWLTSSANADSFAPGSACFFTYTLAVSLRYSGGGYTTPNVTVTRGGPNVGLFQIAYNPGGAFSGGWHQFAGGTKIS